MKKLTPRDYLTEFYPGTSICVKTVTNWIKKGKIKGEQTPSGRWLVLVDDELEKHVRENQDLNQLVKLLEMAGL